MAASLCQATRSLASTRCVAWRWIGRIAATCLTTLCGVMLADLEAGGAASGRLTTTQARSLRAGTMCVQGLALRWGHSSTEAYMTRRHSESVLTFGEIDAALGICHVSAAACKTGRTCVPLSTALLPKLAGQKLHFVTGSADVGGSQGRRTAPAVARQVWGLTAARAAFSSAPAAFVVEVCVFSPNNHASARAAVGAVQFRRKE